MSIKQLQDHHLSLWTLMYLMFPVKNHKDQPKSDKYIVNEGRDPTSCVL